jgi:hypothetical protein
MATASTSRIPDDPALLGAATAYGIWSGTAKYHKGVLDRFTLWSLRLSIAGALMGAAGLQIGPLVKLPVGKVLAGAGAIAVALAAFLSREAQSNDHVKIWSRARSAAESLKSTIFLARARVGQFGGTDRAAQIKQRVDAVTESMATTSPRQILGENSVDLTPLSLEEYLAKRVNDQIDWYNTRAGQFQTKADWCRNATTVLGLLSAVLALASATDLFAPWTPVIAAITASITAHLKSRQYQVLAATYLMTMVRLTSLLSDWAGSGKTELNTPERDTFIQKCEETMSAENGAWSTMWSEK